MRGSDRQIGKIFSDASPESRVAEDHPFRVIRPLVNAALDRLSGKFEAIYSPFGRESVAPEKLLRALLRQAFFGVPSERQFMEQLQYDVPLVRRPVAGRCGLGRNRVHQKPQTPAGG